MRHQRGNKKIGRPTDQRLALLKSQAKSLIEHGELMTSRAKAKALARFVQKLVTLARKGDVGSMRLIRKQLSNRDLIKKLKDDIVPNLQSDQGGEISVIPAGQRRGDGTHLAVVTFNTTE